MAKKPSMAERLAALETIKSLAGELIRSGFQQEPGGDAYRWIGSTNDIDGLRDAISDYELLGYDPDEPDEPDE